MLPILAGVVIFQLLPERQSEYIHTSMSLSVYVCAITTSEQECCSFEDSDSIGCVISGLPFDNWSGMHAGACSLSEARDGVIVVENA